MVPSFLFDISALDLEGVLYDAKALDAVNPQRGVMRMIDGVSYVNHNGSEGVAFKDVGHDEFWTEGHIPGRPLLPGVLMLEAAAQMASFLLHLRIKEKAFYAFVGIKEAKFRSAVLPGDRLLILGKEVSFRPKRMVCDAQGVVRGKLVFEARIKGLPM